MVLMSSAAQWLADLRQALAELSRLDADPTSTTGQKSRARKAVTKAQNKYRHRQVKDALVQMFRGKCAYCESSVTVVAYGHIEHFYPKADYVDRTFQWDNLLLSCEVCNNPHYKGTNFPMDNLGNPLLINPTTSRPENHLLFSWDPIARIAAVYGRDACGKETVKTFDLNGVRGRKELLKSRSKHVRKLMALLELATDGNAEARALLIEASSPEEPYAAFAQALL